MKPNIKRVTFGNNSNNRVNEVSQYRDDDETDRLRSEIDELRIQLARRNSNDDEINFMGVINEEEENDEQNQVYFTLSKIFSMLTEITTQESDMKKLLYELSELQIPFKKVKDLTETNWK